MNEEKAACPMASMCKGMTGGSGSGWFAGMLIAGILLIAVGALVILEPRILIWLAAAVFIALGIGVMFLAGGLRRMSRRFSQVGHSAH